MKHFISQRNTQGGFTLIELMVALMLFTIVVLAAVSSLYTVNNAYRKVQAMRTVLDNLNFAVESMSRTIRTGSNIGGNGIYGMDFTFETGPAQDIILHSTFGDFDTVRYQLCTPPSPDCIDYPGGVIQKRVGGSGNNYVSLTSPEIDVQQLYFYIEGSCPPSGMAYGDSPCDPGIGKQPSVMMFVIGVATAGDDVAPFAVQTYVSQRTVE